MVSADADGLSSVSDTSGLIRIRSASDPFGALQRHRPVSIREDTSRQYIEVLKRSWEGLAKIHYASRECTVFHPYSATHPYSVKYPGISLHSHSGRLKLHTLHHHSILRIHSEFHAVLLSIGAVVASSSEKLIEILIFGRFHAIHNSSL